jgi:hypothetical protein
VLGNENKLSIELKILIVDELVIRAHNRSSYASRRSGLISYILCQGCYSFFSNYIDLTVFTLMKDKNCPPGGHNLVNILLTDSVKARPCTPQGQSLVRGDD